MQYSENINIAKILAIQKHCIHKLNALDSHIWDEQNEEQEKAWSNMCGRVSIMDRAWDIYA